MRSLAAILTALVTLGGLLTGAAAPAAALPEGFVDEPVVDVASPTAFAFTPDGRMLVTTQQGLLRVVEDGTLVDEPALDLSDVVCDDFERGLLGVAVAPDFADSNQVYLYYTHVNSAGGCPSKTADIPFNRVSRLTLGDDGIVDASSEEVLVDRLPSYGGNHNAGDLQFGSDGMLYVSVGDGGTDYDGSGGSAGSNDAAREPNTLLGKVLRLTPEGDAPDDNPYAATGDRCALTGRTTEGRRCQETYASGFRNPFRLAMDPNADEVRLFANDVGQNAYEEVDEVLPGRDYGWNLCEGVHPNGGRATAAECDGEPYVAPVHEYAASSGCRSITGGAFVPDGVWPDDYDGAYLYADYVCGSVFALDPDSGERRTLLTGLGGSSAVHLGFGPTEDGQALYYTTYAGGGEIRRLRFAGAANTAPQAAFRASPSAGPVPLDVAFDGSASSDPDGDPLTYEWDFGDGSARVTTQDPTIGHTYTQARPADATLVVIDSKGARSFPATLTINPGSAPPEVTIEAPPDGDTYAVGQRVVLRGSAFDEQDGRLPGDALSWTVTVVHDEHTHPFVPPTTGEEVTFTAPPPEDLAAVTTTALDVALTATDSDGITQTEFRRILPRRVDVTLDSEPEGLVLQVEGTSVATPAVVPSVACLELDLAAPDQRAPDGTTARFESWSDGGEQAHPVVTGAEPETLTATYAPGSGDPGPVPAPPRVPVDRVAGTDRVTTAVQLSRERFTDCGQDGGTVPLADTVVIARADQYPDALAGGPLAFALDAPVLLTSQDSLSAATADEVERLGATRAVLLGGPSALSPGVADDLTTAGLAVDRLSGANRYDTARLIAERLPPGELAYVVEGANVDPGRGWPDAVSASWLAARQGAPVLLVTRDQLPSETRLALDQRGVARATVVGGTGAVSDAVAQAVADGDVQVTRVGGATRYQTSRLLAERAGSLDGSTAFLATGLAFPDALSAGPSVAASAGVLQLVDGRDLDDSPPARDFVAQSAPQLGRVVLVGGTSAVSAEVESDVRALTR